MKKLNNFICFALTFLFLTSMNLYFSGLISHKLIEGWKYSSSILNLVYIENTGAAFSIMQNSTKILIIVSFVAILAIFYYVVKNLRESYMKELLFLAFLLSGILGNLYERVSFGYVRDFFELSFVNFPIFNISDVFINIGVLGIIILILLTKKSIRIL